MNKTVRSGGLTLADVWGYPYATYNGKEELSHPTVKPRGLCPDLIICDDVEESNMSDKMTVEEFKELEKKRAEVEAEFNAADTYKVEYKPSTVDDDGLPCEHPFPYTLLKKRLYLEGTPSWHKGNSPPKWCYKFVANCSSVQEAKAKAKIDSEMPVTFNVGE